RSEGVGVHQDVGMLPALGQIEAAFAFLTRRYALTFPFPAAAMSQALEDAHALVQTDRDEPAALFYALCMRARALGALWPVLPNLVAINHASSLGLSMRFDYRVLRSLRVRIAARSIDFEEVRRALDTLIV